MPGFSWGPRNSRRYGYQNFTIATRSSRGGFLAEQRRSATRRTTPSSLRQLQIGETAYKCAHRISNRLRIRKDTIYLHAPCADPLDRDIFRTRLLLNEIRCFNNSAISMAGNRDVSVCYIQFVSLLQYFEIISLAKANNLQPLTNKPQDLFQLDTSYVRVGNEILVLVHVPCSNPSSLLIIYKYVPFPIPVRPTG